MLLLYDCKRSKLSNYRTKKQCALYNYISLYFWVTHALHNVHRHLKIMPSICFFKGPRNWPLVGTLLAMIPQPEDSPFDVLEKQRKKYGNIVGLFMGTQPAILISGMEDVKEISAREEFIYRPQVTGPQHKIFGHQPHGHYNFD